MRENASSVELELPESPYGSVWLVGAGDGDRPHPWTPTLESSSPGTCPASPATTAGSTGASAATGGWGFDHRHSRLARTTLSEEVFAFGSFRLIPAQRSLLDADAPVPLGGRAFDLLHFLVEKPGEIIANDALMARVWPNVSVEEVNLRVHIAAVRKALRDGVSGSRFILNVPGRGYSFVGAVERREEPQQAREPPATGPSPAHKLPARLTRVIGRTEVIREVVEQVPQRRFLTIVGPGGIGKTTVALAVAEVLAATYRDGVAFVDLTPVSDPALVPSALAATLGLVSHYQDAVSGLAAWLHDKQMLIVLDSCEHVVETAAALVEALLRGAPGVSVLATSREPLRGEGEWVRRLPPLGLPPASAKLTAMQALGFPAVQLFVERAAASLGSFELGDADARIVAEICRRLDGIALAIELAAGRVDAFGLSELARLLDDRFRVLTRGRRTALPRHQTLRATLDWSYWLLPGPEQLTLQRLSIFSGAFTLTAAREVVADRKVDAADIGDVVAGLVAKSLIAAEVGDAAGQYRLLDTTQAYAREKLATSGECDEVAGRHAAYHQKLFERAEAEWDTRPTAEWLTAYARHIDDLRAALNWAFSPAGKAMVGVALAAAAAPLWFELSLVDEGLGWIERALAAVPSPGERRSMQLHAALGWLQTYATGRLESSLAAWGTALRFAEQLGDTDYQLRALKALWADRIYHGEFREALAPASRFRRLAAGTPDEADQLVGDRMTGFALHFLGDQAGARQHIERMLARYQTPVSRSHVVRFQFHQGITARITLARVLWLQGYADQALRNVEATIACAVEVDHVLSLANALVQAACPVALLAGDVVAAERYTEMLRHHTTMRALGVWRAYADCFDGELAVRRGDPDRGLSLLRGGVDYLKRGRFVQYQTPFVTALALGLAAVGRPAEARAAVEDALVRCDATGESWSTAEVQRVRGEMLLQENAPGNAEAAEAALLQSLGIARAQKVLAWELRSAMSLARLWRGRHRKEARDLLASVYTRFSEGFGTADLIDAASLLEDLGHPTPRTPLYSVHAG
jgi:predicted ATPase/DNA-binding winged helix-turn-helix (wHTH) protein